METIKQIEVFKCPEDGHWAYRLTFSSGRQQSGHAEAFAELTANPRLYDLQYAVLAIASARGLGLRVEAVMTEVRDGQMFATWTARG